jgi:hypothetical protein
MRGTWSGLGLLWVVPWLASWEGDSRAPAWRLMEHP